MTIPEPKEMFEMILDLEHKLTNLVSLIQKKEREPDFDLLEALRWA